MKISDTFNLLGNASEIVSVLIIDIMYLFFFT